VERAIVVDDQLRVADEPDIYAAGECVQHRGQTYGLVAPLWEQAKVLADHVTGKNPKAAYHGSRTATELRVAGVDVAAMGITAPEREDDEFVVFSEPGRGVYKSAIIRHDRLIGATLLGDAGKVGFLMQAFDRGLPLPEKRVRLFFDLGAPPAEVSAAKLDDTAQVCNCNGVSKATLVSAVRGGTRTVTGVMNATHAGKGCGSCKPLVAQIVEWAAGGTAEEDPAADWYVPGIPMSKAELMAAIRARQLKSVSPPPLGRDEDPAERLAALGVLVRRGGIREGERAIDLHLEFAACDALEHGADHWMDAGVLGQDRAAEVDAAQRVVMCPE
jgi:nitrite reductase (NADH) large subunit